MTERERWILYPLLFLALGAALRDKVVPPEKLEGGLVQANAVEARSIRAPIVEAGVLKADNFQIRDDKGRVRLLMALRPVVITDGEEQTQVLTPQIVTYDEQGDAQFAVHSGQVFGSEISSDVLHILDTAGQPKVIIDAVPLTFQTEEETTKVSQGRIQVFDIQNRPSVAMHAELQASNLRARQINVQGESDTPAMILAAMPILGADGEPSGDTAGHFALYGKQAKPLVQISPHANNSEGLVQIQSDSGKKRMTLHGDLAGGKVTTYHGSRDLSLSIGHYPPYSGILARSGNTPLLPYSRLLPKQQLESLPERPQAAAPAQPAAAVEGDGAEETSESEDASGEEPTKADEVETEPTPADDATIDDASGESGDAETEAPAEESATDDAAAEQASTEADES